MQPLAFLALGVGEIIVLVVPVMLIVAITIARAAASGPGGPIICPNANCGYRGRSKRVPRGSLFIGLFLCLFGFLPGILYFILRSGYRVLCPKCGLQMSADV